MSDEGKAVATWWRAVESGGATGGGIEDVLARAARAESDFRTDEASRLLDEVGAMAQGPWSGVLALIRSRIRVRVAKDEALGALRPEVVSLLASEVDAATAVRARFLLGTIASRTDAFDEAEEHFLAALRGCGDDPVRMRVLDSICSVLVVQGSWIVARRALEALVAWRRREGDGPGAAISAGHLARLLHELGEHAAVISGCDEALATPGLSEATSLRFQTLRMQSRVDGGVESPREEVEALDRQIAAAPSGAAGLKGYGALALARAAALRGDDAAVEAALVRAEGFVAQQENPEQQALVEYWRSELRRLKAWDPSAWEDKMAAFFTRAGGCCEAEVLTGLRFAREAARDGRRVDGIRRLEALSTRVAACNHPAWQRPIDEAWRELAPERLADLLVRRFSGVSLQTLARSRREEVTIVFADLVGFTPRSVHMEPEEVMETARALFELMVPALARHRVRPVSYLGDAILAVAEGADHVARGVAFAEDIVRRAWRVSEVRKALGDRGELTIRSGVATGPAVLGVLGNLAKVEYAAIGFKTSLAARLQGAAEPDEVLCDGDTARALGIGEEQMERLMLKGISEPEAAYRWKVGGAELLAGRWEKAGGARFIPDTTTRRQSWASAG